MTGDSCLVVEGDAVQILPTLATASIDMIITDPPYSSGGLYRGDRANTVSSKYLGDRLVFLPEFAGDMRDQRGWAYWCHMWLTECLRVAKPGAIITISVDWRQLPSLTDTVQAAGWVWRGILAWAKPDPRPQLGRPAQACEFIVWATNGARQTVGPTVPGWWLERAPRDRIHQTQKPLQIYRDLATLCPADGTILDPFCGSGTTGVAALTTGRRFVGIEASPDYAAAARTRLDAITRPTAGQLPLDLDRSLTGHTSG